MPRVCGIETRPFASMPTLGSGAVGRSDLELSSFVVDGFGPTTLDECGVTFDRTEVGDCHGPTEPSFVSERREPMTLVAVGVTRAGLLQ